MVASQSIIVMISLKYQSMYSEFKNLLTIVVKCGKMW